MWKNTKEVIINKPNRNKDGKDWERLRQIANDKLEKFKVKSFKMHHLSFKPWPQLFKGWITLSAG